MFHLSLPFLLLGTLAILFALGLAATGPAAWGGWGLAAGFAFATIYSILHNNRRNHHARHRRH
jgi:hypothetical protein